MLLLIFFLLSARVEVFFSATDGCEDNIVKSIDSAKRSIYIASYSLTSREISEAIVRAKERGLDVKVITDPHQSSQKFSKINFLKNNGVDIRVPLYDSTKGKRFLTPKMHHKFIIFDQEYVMTGSYNLTASAEDLNDENCVFIYDDKGVVEKFYQEFQRIWKISK